MKGYKYLSMSSLVMAGAMGAGALFTFTRGDYIFGLVFILLVLLDIKMYRDNAEKYRSEQTSDAFLEGYKRGYRKGVENEKQ